MNFPELRQRAQALVDLNNHGATDAPFSQYDVHNFTVRAVALATGVLALSADAPMTYLAKNLRSQLERGPAEGEDFFRLKVTGNGETNWLNVKPSQLVAIIVALGDAA